MKKIRIGQRHVLWSWLFVAGLAGLGAMPVAQAVESPILVRVTAIVVSPDAKSKALDLDVVGTADLAVDFTYFVSPNIGFNLLATVLNPEIESGGNSVGSIGLVPPILTAQYHFAPGPMSFYVGAGLNYNIFHDETGQLDTLAPGVHPSVKDTIGYVAQIGLDMELTENTVLNLDLKYLTFDADVRAGGQKVDKLEVDAIIFGIGLGWRL